MTKIDTNRQVSDPSTAQDGTDNGTNPAQREARGEPGRTARLAAALPLGIQIGRWTDARRKPWYVRWGSDKARRTKSFVTERERNDQAETLQDARAEHGAAVLAFDPAAWAEYSAFRARCPAPLAELEALWAKHHRRGDGLNLGATIDRYLKLRLAEDLTERSDTYSHLKLHLRRLKDAYGAVGLEGVNAPLLRELMDGLTDPDTKRPMSKLTKRHHRKSWNVFFKRCVAERWIEHNPCATVIPPKVRVADKVPLTPREVFALLHANRDHPVAGRIVYELFGGLRCSSVERLRKIDVKRAAKGITLPGAVEDAETGELKNNHKSQRTKYRQGQPDVLWAWVDHAGDAAWSDITEKNYDEQKRDAFVRANVRNPGNVLRETFASYLLAATKDMPRVGYLMQHTNIHMTSVYEGVADEADARCVLAMTPDAVRGTFEEFLAAHGAHYTP